MSSKVFLLVVLLLFVTSSAAETKANGKTKVECKETSCGKVPNAIHSLFVSKDTEVKYQATCHNVSEKGTLRYQAKLQCYSPDYMLKKTELDCKSGKWIPTPQANCTLKPKKSFFEQHKWVIIGGSGGGALCLIVIIVIGITVHLVRKKRQRKLLDEMRTDMSVDEGVSNPAYGMGSVYSFGVLGRSGYHKVWSCKRNRKKFIHGETLQSLLKAASGKFGYTGDVRLALEEDGTEVDNEEIFNACAGRVFVLLRPGEKWLDGAYESLVNTEKRLTFDVCSYNRKMRKLIMANSLQDLIHQGSAMVNYVVTRVCLEEDGTVLDDSDALFACVSETLILLGNDHMWTSSEDEIPSISRQERSETNQSISDLDERVMYKVWSAGRQQKKLVFAENVIDLHLKASKCLGLETPVKVTVDGTDIEIIEDYQLLENRHKVLIVTSINTKQTTGNMYSALEGFGSEFSRDVGDSYMFNYDPIRGDQSRRYSKQRHHTVDGAYNRQTHSNVMHDHPLDGSDTPEYRMIRPPDVHPGHVQNPEGKRYSLHSQSNREIHENHNPPLHHGVAHDLPPGGTDTPGYRMMESSNKHLRHIQDAGSKRDSMQRSDNKDNHLPYQDLRPAHHVHRGKLRPQDDGIELSDMKYDQHRASAKSHHGSRHQSDRPEYRRPFDVQMSDRPYVVTGDSPQTWKSDVLF